MNDSTEQVLFLRLWKEDTVREMQIQGGETVVMLSGTMGRLYVNGTFGCVQRLAISGGLEGGHNSYSDGNTMFP